MRTRFKKDIICEVAAPARVSKRAIILASGLPSSPPKKTVMEFLAKAGYWVFFPRYRGTWESSGRFLRHSPHEDLLDVVDELPRGFTSLWDGKKFAPDAKEVILLGSSFGGAAVLLASRDPRIAKTVALSPVVDWSAPSKEEPLEWFGQFVSDAFGEAYRFDMKDWKKLGSGDFFNPMSHADEIDGSNTLIFHAKDDRIVDYRPVEKFAKKVEASLRLWKKGGHFSSSDAMSPRIFPIIKRFL